MGSLHRRIRSQGCLKTKCAWSIRSGNGEKTSLFDRNLARGVLGVTNLQNSLVEQMKETKSVCFHKAFTTKGHWVKSFNKVYFKLNFSWRGRYFGFKSLVLLLCLGYSHQPNKYSSLNIFSCGLKLINLCENNTKYSRQWYFTCNKYKFKKRRNVLVSKSLGIKTTESAYCIVVLVSYLVRFGLNCTLQNVPWLSYVSCFISFVYGKLSPTTDEVRGKVMFSLVCVILFTEGEGGSQSTLDLIPWTMDCWSVSPDHVLLTPPRPRTVALFPGTMNCWPISMGPWSINPYPLRP